MAYSIDLRERVVSAIDSGMHTDVVRKIFKISTKTIYLWLALREKTGCLAPKTCYQKGHSHKITDWEIFKDFAQKNNQCSSSQMRIKWKELTNVVVSESVMLRALRRIGFTFKKKRLIIPKQTRKKDGCF